MSPTSSVLPIKDPIAERRLYLGMLGLLIVLLGLLSRLRLDRTRLIAILGAVCLVGLVLAHARAQVWSDEVVMWQDAVSKTPQKARPHFQLGAVWLRQGRCDLAAAEFETTSKLQKPSYDLFVDWALALDCMNQPEPALAKLREAAALENTAHVHSQIGMVYAKQSRWAEALEAVDRSLALDGNYGPALAYRGAILLATGDAAGALATCDRALAASPGNPQAIECREKARLQLGGATR
jgi:tetratricopeptide (TPR) repeat protein